MRCIQIVSRDSGKVWTISLDSTFKPDTTSSLKCHFQLATVISWFLKSAFSLYIKDPCEGALF